MSLKLNIHNLSLCSKPTININFPFKKPKVLPKIAITSVVWAAILDNLSYPKYQKIIEYDLLVEKISIYVT